MAFKAKFGIILLFLGAAAVISTAWGFQLLGGYVPCKLCLEQRVPYYVALPLIVLALIARLKNRNLLALAFLVLVGIVFAYGSGLGVYQAGAEWAFWPGPNDCGGGSAMATTTADLLKGLQTQRIVSCSEASWRMLGLSFAGWNAVASAGLSLLAFFSGYLCVYRRRGA
ncbi:disulfide bond formation protein B [Roseibium aestuarii]|uniref:Disulfide bond formation protein B n=1 Tax=Roseibium aestuarii TaxID=2600299 RepID=A0ABW4K4X9_9HYPH|nr:disulfide bond formation protein B [Roseibium aestuarii]